MLAAILAICAGECVRGLRAYGSSASIGRYSICRLGVMELKNPPSVAAGRVRNIQGVVTVWGGGNHRPVTWPGRNLFFRADDIELLRCCPTHTVLARKDPSIVCRTPRSSGWQHRKSAMSGQ